MASVDYDLILYNNIGKENESVAGIQNNTYIFDLSKLSSGTYFLKIQTLERSEIRTLVIQ